MTSHYFYIPRGSTIPSSTDFQQSTFFNKKFEALLFVNSSMFSTNPFEILGIQFRSFWWGSSHRLWFEGGADGRQLAITPRAEYNDRTRPQGIQPNPLKVADRDIVYLTLEQNNKGFYLKAESHITGNVTSWEVDDRGLFTYGYTRTLPKLSAPISYDLGYKVNY